MEEVKKQEEGKKRINVRNSFFILGGFMIILIMFLTDADKGVINDIGFGSTTITYLIYLSTGILGVGILYLCERALFYLVDWYETFKIAKQTPLGAGLALIAISVQMVAVAIVLQALWG